MTNIPPKITTPPLWLTEHYEGMEQDIKDYLYALFFHKMWGGADTDEIGQAKVSAEREAEIRLAAMIQAGDLQGAFKDTLVLQALEAKETGWYVHLQEFRAIEELLEIALQRQIERDPEGGMRYEIQDLLKIIPALEQMGVDKSLILSIPHNKSKARESAKVIKYILQSPASEKKKLKATEEILKDVANSDVTFQAFRDKNRERMGKVGKTTVTPVPGYLYLLPGGKEFVVIETTNPAQTRAIESALKGLVETFTPREISHLLQTVSTKALTKGKQHYYQCKMVEDKPRIVRGSDGILLPTPDEFNQLALRELSYIRDYFNRLFPSVQYLDVLVYEISRGVSLENPGELVGDLFKFNQDDPFDEVNTAIGEFYSGLSLDVRTLINFWDSLAILKFDEESKVLGIYLRIWEKVDEPVE